MTLLETEVVRSLTNRILHLILLPTEACNFRCVYCYEDFRYKRMEPWVVRGIKRLISRRAAGLDLLSISWFGGEPLLASDIIEDIMVHSQSVTQAHPGALVRAGITTNAYLLSRPVFERFLDLGIGDFQISFDGPREHHDRKRVQAGGRGTFDRIWANVVSMTSVDRAFSVIIRVHVDEENKSAIPEFIDLYRHAFGEDERFRLFVRPLSRLGGPNDHALPVLLPEDADRTIAKLRAYAASQHLRQAPGAPAEMSTEVCYAARGNSFVVRANGRLNKCTVALEHPSNQVGTIREDGTVDIRARLMGQWMRGLGSGNLEELRCPMMGLVRSQ